MKKLVLIVDDDKYDEFSDLFYKTVDDWYNYASMLRLGKYTTEQENKAFTRVTTNTFKLRRMLGNLVRIKIIDA
jgi:hypothetical protein